MTSSWYSVARCVSSTTTAASTTSGRPGSPRFADSRVSRGRTACPPLRRGGELVAGDVGRCRCGATSRSRYLDRLHAPGQRRLQRRVGVLEGGDPGVPGTSSLPSLDAAHTVVLCHRTLVTLFVLFIGRRGRPGRRGRARGCGRTPSTTVTARPSASTDAVKALGTATVGPSRAGSSEEHEHDPRRASKNAVTALATTPTTHSAVAPPSVAALNTANLAMKPLVSGMCPPARTAGRRAGRPASGLLRPRPAQLRRASPRRYNSGPGSTQGERGQHSEPVRQQVEDRAGQAVAVDGR